jgi:hypothetical protein
MNNASSTRALPTTITPASLVFDADEYLADLMFQDRIQRLKETVRHLVLTFDFLAGVSRVGFAATKKQLASGEPVVEHACPLCHEPGHGCLFTAEDMAKHLRRPKCGCHGPARSACGASAKWQGGYVHSQQNGRSGAILPDSGGE